MIELETAVDSLKSQLAQANGRLSREVARADAAEQKAGPGLSSVPLGLPSWAISVGASQPTNRLKLDPLPAGRPLLQAVAGDNGSNQDVQGQQPRRQPAAAGGARGRDWAAPAAGDFRRAAAALPVLQRRRDPGAYEGHAGQLRVTAFRSRGWPPAPVPCDVASQIFRLYPGVGWVEVISPLTHTCQPERQQPAVARCQTSGIPLPVCVRRRRSSA